MWPLSLFKILLCVEYSSFSDGIYVIKVNGNSRTMCEICSKLSMSQWRCSGVFIRNFEQVLSQCSGFSIDIEQVNTGLFIAIWEALHWVFIKFKGHIKNPVKMSLLPRRHDVNWTYIRRSEEVLHVFWTSYVRSIYIRRGKYDQQFLQKRAIIDLWQVLNTPLQS